VSAQKGKKSAPRHPPKNATSHMASVVLSRHAEAIIPEQRLWLDVILQAVRECKTKSYGQGCHSFFRSQTFDRACHFVGLNPEFAREIVRKIGSPIDQAIIDACYPKKTRSQCK